ncbi:MAG: hypothetical protein FJZ57_05210 [Chlamydiae bacterium]|nr:hypothetical protein [Chlamydiota bacterium]
MKPADRQKICTNCDGRIPVEAQECLYCGSKVVLSQEMAAPSPAFDHQSIQDSLSSLYAPPYSNMSANDMKNDKDKNKPKPILRESQDNQLHAALGKFNHSQTTPVDPIQEREPGKSSFMPLLMLLLGGNLLIIGLLQFFFSENGVLRLEWQSKYWFVYFLISVPVILLGYKKANDCKEG